MDKDVHDHIDPDLLSGLESVGEDDSVFSPRTPHDLYMFEALFRSQKSKLTAFIRKHIRNAAAVDDIVQQAFLEAYRCWHKFRGESKPETWLYGIALNIVRNSVSRSPEYRFTFEDTDQLGEQYITETAEDPLVSALRTEMIGRLREAIRVLPESMASVVQMVVLDGYSYQDTSQELRIPVGTVRSRLSRARDTLRVAVE
jgi:RNA polymerase sigma-70 factor (ECF subfamily)